MRLIDSHLHLQDPNLLPDCQAILQRAAQAGVVRFICNGTCEADWPLVAQLARQHPPIIPCFGLHPWHVNQRSEHWASALERFLDQIPSGVGEIGLDRWIEGRDEPAQEQVFRLQLQLARQRRRPVMIHCLRAWGWLMDVLKSEAVLPGGFLLHAYGGPVELIGPLAERGAYFSFAGNVFEAKRASARAALAAVPLDRLLIETDAPDMLPPPEYRLHTLRGPDGKLHNEPANLPAILRGAAQLRSMPEGQLAQTLWQNAHRFFNAESSV